jgi:hypothetical protein
MEARLFFDFQVTDPFLDSGSLTAVAEGPFAHPIY